MTIPMVCTIAESDVSGGAGVQSDLHTFHNLGVHGYSIITAIGDSYYLPPHIVEAELQSLSQDVRAIKIGILGDCRTIDILIDFLHQYKGFVVLNMLLVSSSDYLRKLKQLFPYINLLTLNKNEAEILLARRIVTHADVIAAAEDSLAMGVKSVVIKGGHFDGDDSQDYWSDGNEAFWLTNKRYENSDVSGASSAFSSAVAASVALGYSLKDALVIANMYVNRGMRYAKHGKFFQHMTSWPEEEIDVPVLHAQPVNNNRPSFMRDDLFKIGLYPIVDSLEWLKILLSLGIKCIQLRIKNKTGEALAKEIQESIILSKQYQVKLFINDYWQLAIAFGADGVHLGQEDLHIADVQAIHAAGLQLGISTNSYAEVALAHFYRPSYIACGPIFITTSKVMSSPPQGLQSLARWRKTLSYPLIAIGGINHENIMEILSENVDGVALISAITKADHPVIAAEQLMKMVNAHLDD